MRPCRVPIKCTNLLVSRDPIQREDLASQPSLSRFENSRDRKQLFHLSEALAEDRKLSFGREPVLCFIKGDCRPQDWVLRLFPNGLDKLSLR
jgi:hypothetical protein